MFLTSYWPEGLIKKKFTSLLKTLIIFFFFTLNFNTQGQKLNIIGHLSIEDGLSLSIVTKIIQDKRGFLWFGTYNGLNRYDGYNFKIFLPEHTNRFSISNYSIWAMYEDSKGYIWIGTMEGLNRYDWKTEKFYRYMNDPKDPNSLSNNYVLSIYEDKSGRIIVGTQNGLNIYNREKDNFAVTKKISNELNVDSLNSVTCTEEDYQSNIWLGTWKGLTCLKKDGSIENVILPGSKDLITFRYNQISDIYADNNKNLWVGTNNGQGLFKYNLESKTFSNYSNTPKNPQSISDNRINFIFRDELNSLWVGTKNGLNKFDPATNKFERFYHDPINSFSIINNDVLSILIDKTELLWIGTSGGISKGYQPINSFGFYSKNFKGSKFNLSSTRVTSVKIDHSQNIWIATPEGLDEIRNSTNQLIRYKHIPGNKNSLSDNFVMSVTEDNSGIIWIGTEGSGLNSYDPQNGKFANYSYKESDFQSISNNGIVSICVDRNNNLWVGTWWGLNLLDEKRTKFERFTNFKNNLIWVIYEDSKGMLWTGTDGGGVNEFNPKTKTFRNFMHDTTGINNICGNRVISILESKDGIMWFGTLDGLSNYDRNTGQFKTYGINNGLPSNSINSINEDKKGFLWIGTENGISKFDRKNGVFKNYNKRNGLPEIQFSANASDQSIDGHIYSGTVNGLMFFNPDSIKDSHINVSIVFTDLKLFNQSILISQEGNSILNESITGVKNVNIPYNSDVITIEFASLDFFNVKRNKFQYKLEGFDKGWNDVGTRNSATYTNLPPGDYTFFVKVSNPESFRKAKEASLKITIVPLYYQTWWFKVLLAVVLFLGTIMIVQMRISRIKKLNKILGNRVAERTKDLDKTINELNQKIGERKTAESIVQTSLKEKEVLLKEIHHRVKNNLQVISSLLYLNSKKINDREVLEMFKDSQNRVKSIALVHERLYQSKDLGRIDFKDYAQKLTNDLMRSYAVNQASITLENNIENIFISIDTAVPCGLIINELISNSFKYAFPNYEAEKKNGIISINFNHLGGNQLLLVVSDNGIGIQGDIEEKKNSSLGLQLVETLVAQLEGTLEIDLTKGTSFIIKFMNPQAKQKSNLKFLHNS